MTKNIYAVLVHWKFCERKNQKLEHRLDTMVERQLTIHGSLKAF